MLNGVRHLSWDLGYGFDLTTVYKTGYSVLITAIILTTITWLGVWLY